MNPGDRERDRERRLRVIIATVTPPPAPPAPAPLVPPLGDDSNVGEPGEVEGGVDDEGDNSRLDRRR